MRHTLTPLQKPVLTKGAFTNRKNQKSTSKDKDFQSCTHLLAHYHISFLSIHSKAHPIQPPPLQTTTVFFKCLSGVIVRTSSASFAEARGFDFLKEVAELASTLI
jgi:hypothetical protein